jgi:hypothetical protein
MGFEMKIERERRVSRKNTPRATGAADELAASPAPWNGQTLRGIAGGRAAPPSALPGALVPGNVAYGIACRFFCGFTHLPGAWLPSLDEHAALFEPSFGPLSLGERETIARGLTGDDGPGFGRSEPAAESKPSSRDAAGGSRGASGADAAARDGLLQRYDALHRFALSWRGREELRLSHVERLLEAGFTRDEIREAVRACLAFTFVERLCAAASLRPTAAPCAMEAPVARRRAAAR